MHALGRWVPGCECCNRRACPGIAAGGLFNTEQHWFARRIDPWTGTVDPVFEFADYTAPPPFPTTFKYLRTTPETAEHGGINSTPFNLREYLDPLEAGGGHAVLTLFGSWLEEPVGVLGYGVPGWMGIETNGDGTIAFVELNADYRSTATFFTMAPADPWINVDRPLRHGSITFEYLTPTTANVGVAYGGARYYLENVAVPPYVKRGRFGHYVETGNGWASGGYLHCGGAPPAPPLCYARCGTPWIPSRYYVDPLVGPPGLAIPFEAEPAAACVYQVIYDDAASGLFPPYTLQWRYTFGIGDLTEPDTTASLQIQLFRYDPFAGLTFLFSWLYGTTEPVDCLADIPLDFMRCHLNDCAAEPVAHPDTLTMRLLP